MNKVEEEKALKGKSIMFIKSQEEKNVSREEFKFRKLYGFSNPVNHMRHCLSGGSRNELLIIFHAYKKA